MKSLLEKIAVMQAAADGKEIQWRRSSASAGKWEALHPQVALNHDWLWNQYDYRVKPREPKVIYVNEHEAMGYAYYDRAVASVQSSRMALRTAVKYQEVIEDEKG